MRSSGSLILLVVVSLAAGCKVSGLPDGGLSPDAAPTQDSDQSRGTHQSDSGSNSSDGGEIVGSNTGGSDGGAILRFKPALAVRGAGCFMCHGQVRSNIITDFGYQGDGQGNDYFFGQGAGGLTPLSGSMYGDHGTNWRSARVWAKVIVPEASVTQVLPAAVPQTLAAYMEAVLVSPEAGVAAPVVEEKESVYIGAPTAARILSRAGRPAGIAEGYRFIPSSSTDVAAPVLEQDPSRAYWRNPQGRALDCDGDLVVDGILFLNNVRINTEKGCRIYATHTVIVQGTVTYAPLRTRSNLQITSSRAILLGLGYGPVHMNGAIRQHSLVHRFQEMWTRAGYFTREAGTTQEKLDRIVSEAQAVLEATDAALQPTGREVGFDRLLINAPTIQSRYQGEFKGVIIAETLLASLGQFAFHFDEVFSQVSVLPLIPAGDYLSVSP